MASKKMQLTADDHVRGSLEAPIVLVEYGDYQCEFCHAAHPIVQRLRRTFKKDMAFVFRNFPLTSIHPDALPMAERAEAAAVARNFWNVHDILMSSDSFRLAQKKLGLLAPDIRTALRSQKMRQKIREKIEADITSGIHMGVNGTPTFFINGKRYDGEHSFLAMEEYISAVLRKIK